MESTDRQQTITARVLDFLAHRAALQRGRVFLDVSEIVVTLARRFPRDDRPRICEVETALCQLRTSGSIIGGQGRLIRVLDAGRVRESRQYAIGPPAPPGATSAAQ